MSPPHRSAPPVAPVWVRAEQRPVKEPLSRDRIVAAAVAIADADGLDAVSVRRIAAQLQARPMSLYAHVSSKEDLLELMHDHVVGDALLGDVPEDWKEGLRMIARSTREVALRHPWMIATSGDAPRFGPNTLRHADESAGAVRSLDLSDATKRALLIAVDTYTMGHVMMELAGSIRRRPDREVEQARRAATAHYVRREVAAGAYPHLATFDVDELVTAGDAGAHFEQGLDWLLTGVEATLPRDRHGGAART